MVSYAGLDAGPEGARDNESFVESEERARVICDGNVL